MRAIFKNIKLIDVLILVFVFFAMSGSTASSYLYVTISLCLIVLGVILFHNKFKISLSDKRVLLAGFFLFYIAVMGIKVGGLLFTAKKIGVMIINFSAIIIYNYYISKRNKEARAMLLFGSILIILYYAILAYYAYSRMGVNARRLASHTVDYGDISIGGGYFLAYGLSLLSVFLTDCLKHYRINGTLQRTVSVCVVAFSVVVVYMTLSTTTFLATIVGILLTILSPSVSKILRRKDNIVIMLVGSILVLVVIAVFSDSAGNMLIAIGQRNNNVMGNRISSLGHMLISESMSETYSGGRMSIPLRSLSTFIHNPIFGICYKHGNGYIHPKFFGAGCHCEWTDALCNYGIIGGIPLLSIYYMTLKSIYKETFGEMGVGFAITLLVLGTFNPFICIQTSMIFFLIIPLIVISTQEYDNVKEI